MLLAAPYLPWSRPVDDRAITGSTAIPAVEMESFRLISTADDVGCAVAAGRAGGEERRSLRLASGCVGAVPVLAQARWWIDRPDGTVAFVADDGDVVAEFAEADGAAFESYLPRQPIMILIAE